MKVKLVSNSFLILEALYSSKEIIICTLFFYTLHLCCGQRCMYDVLRNGMREWTSVQYARIICACILS